MNYIEKIQSLWIRTFGRNPTIPEQDETQKIIDKFGYEKTYHIMYEATLLGFKKIRTLVNALDEKGNIKGKENKFTKDVPVRVVMNYEETEKLLKDNEDRLKTEGKWDGKI